MNESVEERFSFAVRYGRVEEALCLLKDLLDLDVNWANENYFRYTALHIASREGRYHIVKALLAHPQINVNVKDRHGYTPCALSCLQMKESELTLLLKDPRVQVSPPNDQCTTLWLALLEKKPFHCGVAHCKWQGSRGSPQPD